VTSNVIPFRREAPATVPESTTTVLETPYTIRVVTTKGNHLFRPEDGNPVERMLALGYVQTGVNRNPRQREELQGAPRFRGLVGPMWDGDALRYEDSKTYSDLSL
jgi:hypothetical protein